MLIGRPKSEIQERSKQIRADFRKRWGKSRRKDLKRDLFVRQSNKCPVCGQPLSASGRILWNRESGETREVDFLLYVDHAISVWIWAETALPIEEACRQANEECNLQLVHAACDRLKSSQDHEEFMECNTKTHRPKSITRDKDPDLEDLLSK